MADAPAMPWYTAFWIVWVLGFVVVEGYALVHPQTGDTLTEHWRWLRDRLGVWAPVFVIGTAIGIIWLFFHWVFGIV